MARRTPTLQGEARRLQEARVLQLLGDYAGKHAEAGDRRAPEAPSLSALAILVDEMGARGSPELRHALPSANYPELPLLGEFRTLWTQLRTAGQLQAALQPAPADTGPLNSARLVQRSLNLMREVSPGYLQHFIQYVDTLLSLELLREPSTQVNGATPTAKGPARTRVRKRR